MPLSPASIVAAAVAILDEYGLGDLTMRRLADSLDVKAGALYWHFPTKQALLAAVADHVLRDAAAPTTSLALPDWCRAWASDLRQVLLSHRDAAELVASARAMDLGSLDPGAPLRARLVAAGHRAGDADAAAQAFLHFLLGHVTQEQTRAQLVTLGVLGAVDPERSEHQFHHGLELLIRGVRSLDFE